MSKKNQSTNFIKLQVSASRLRGGEVPIPGDKSISHRALLFNALSVGTARITGLLEGDDVVATANALRAMGVKISQENEQHNSGSHSQSVWTVHGVGIGGLRDPSQVLDMGNAGTGARLMMGVLATHSGQAILTGDKSLCKRPMARVAEPLSDMGADIEMTGGDRLPAVIRGRAELMPIDYYLPVPSAQIKSAIIIASLAARGTTRIYEPIPCRDHSENMLKQLGAEIEVMPDENSGRIIDVTGGVELYAVDIHVPSDPSSAAFFAAAALIAGQKAIHIKNICSNAMRFGFFEILKEMNADIKISNERTTGGEVLSDITITPSQNLKAINIKAHRAPNMIDEYPILSVVAAYAKGTSRFEGLEELRVKESDRLSAIVDMLRDNGITVRSGDDWMEIDGSDHKAHEGGGYIHTHHDHRIAMSGVVLGLWGRNPLTIDDHRMIATSFPNFLELMTGLGGQIELLEQDE